MTISMPAEEYRIFALGDGALTVEFGKDISVDLNEQALSLAEQIAAHPFQGFVETVPAYASLSVFYDPVVIRKQYSDRRTAFDTVKEIVKHRLAHLGNKSNEESSRLIEIPVRFGGEDGPDLHYVAEKAGLDQSETIDLFVSKAYRVFMLGFLPGFAYMGDVDQRISIPRKSTPALNVPKGSVGIAGRQTGIYPLDSPGGWQIIGRTDLDMFTPDRSELCALRPGDSVKFVHTSK